MLNHLSKNAYNIALTNLLKEVHVRRIIFIALPLFLFACTPPSFEELQKEAHAAYAKAASGQGQQVSDLPRIGETRGDDYRNCIARNFADVIGDKEDFCRWHAGMGSWQLYHNDYRAWLKKRNQ